MVGILHFDGASKGNPGKGGAGAVLMTEDGRVVYLIINALNKFVIYCWSICH
jgi:ribonuclease HI